MFCYFLLTDREKFTLVFLFRGTFLKANKKHGLNLNDSFSYFGYIHYKKLTENVFNLKKCFLLTQEEQNIMHCAAINNHTEIVEYIINDLQMKELDKDDQVKT